MFFVKSHESNFSIVIELVQSIRIQYMIKYYIKFELFLKVYLHLQYIVTTFKFSQIFSLII
jgi:hypothetical protein